MATPAFGPWVTPAALVLLYLLFSVRGQRREDRHGGWVPLVLAGVVFFIMTTWRRGTGLVMQRLRELSIPLPRFLDQVELLRPPRVPGTAVFLTRSVAGTPASLLLHFRHNQVLHREIILLAIVTEEVPEIPEDKRVTSQRLRAGFWRVQAAYGFMQRPDVPRVVATCCEHGMTAEPSRTSYVLGRARLLPTGPGRMMRWRKRVFAFMAWNASSATDFFGLPHDRVIELGARLEFLRRPRGLAGRSDTCSGRSATPPGR